LKKESNWEGVEKYRNYFPNPHKGIGLQHYIKGITEEEYDLLSKMLTLDPRKRITP